MEMNIGVPLQPAIFLWLMGIQVIENHVDLSVWPVGENLIHEIEELSAPAAGIVSGLHHAGGHLQGSEQGGCPVPLILMIESSYGLPIRMAQEDCHSDWLQTSLL